MHTLIINKRFAQRFLVAEIGRIWNARAAGMALLCTLGSGAAIGAPTGGAVVVGDATIVRNGSTTNVDQASRRAVINWNTFNVDAHESVNFRQPDTSSVVLNRVLGNDASAIFGRITANGQVYLVNPNGILFGRDARVDVGGLVASTANISNANFMAGNLRFDQPGRPGATVRNEGTMTITEGGFAVLVGRGAANSGYINARLGKVALAGGDAFVLDLYGDKLVNLIVDPAALGVIGDAHGVPLGAYVDQSGTIVAEGGRVVLAAATVKSLVDNLINVGGVIRATSVDSQGGTISLRGDDSTRLAVNGTLDATGARGGRIEATAHDVALGAGASADASGREGGGDIAIGGNWQGGGSLAHAATTSVARGALLKANALDTGAGGTVAVWSDQVTRFDGQVEARGGASGGNGGQVEVSGKQFLRFDGDVDASGARGLAGRLLLDPTNLIIGSSGQATLPGAAQAGDFTIAASALNRQLVRGTSVTLQADQDITVQAGTQIDGRALSGGVPGAGLGFSAGRNIAIDGVVVLDNGAFDASAGGSFTQGAGSAIATGAGAINIGAATGLAASNLVTNGKVSLASSAGAVTVSEALSGLGGSLLGALDARGRDGVTLVKGALVGGATVLAAFGGRVEVRATLKAGGPVDINAGTSVAVTDIITPGAVALTGEGGVSLSGTVSNAATVIDAGSARSQSLTVRSNGAVDLGGMALGSGGLLVEGLAAGGRAGAARFGNASIFSDGAVSVHTTGDIGFGTGGIAGAGAVLLDSANGAVATGAGLITSGGSFKLAAGRDASVGTGGIDARGADGIVVNARGAVTVDGKLGSVAGVTLGAGGDLALNNDVIAAGIRIDAGGIVRQRADRILAVGFGPADISGTGGIQATNIVTTGRIGLASSGGAVIVAGPLSGSAGQRAAALEVQGRDGVALAGGALVEGAVSLGSSAGLVDTRGGTVDARGGIGIDGYRGVDTAGVLTPAALLVTSATGDVGLGDGASIGAGTLTVRSPGAVMLHGAQLGTGGLTIGGALPEARAASVSFGNAGLKTNGAVTVNTFGNISVGAGGIDAGSTLTFESSRGVVSTGAGHVHAGGDIDLRGSDIGGGIGIGIGQGGIASDGALSLFATNGDVNAVGTIGTGGRTIRITASAANRVTIRDVSTVKKGGSSGALEIYAGDVVLSSALGGETSGYLTASPGYNADQRPAVGRVTIDAARDVELNGLNLDGNDNELEFGSPGLSVVAGNRIVSNKLIAVNKGNIEIRTKGSGAVDGIYLGNSVYSRGYDPVTGNKIGYSIFVDAVDNFGRQGNIILFDNTNDSAKLPESMESLQFREIPKIVVANNVANYGIGTGTESSFLKDASNKADIVVRLNADKLTTLSTAPRDLHLGALPSAGEIVADLGEAISNDQTPGGKAGISLKVQVFKTSGDFSTQPHEVQSEAECSGHNYASCGITNTIWETIRADGTRVTRNRTSESYLPSFTGGQPGKLGFRLRTTGTPDDLGSISGFKGSLAEKFTPRMDQKIVDVVGDFGQFGNVYYSISGRIVQVSDSAPVSRVIIGPGSLQTFRSAASFDGSGNLTTIDNGTASSVDDGRIGASSNPIFKTVDGFGLVAPAVVGTGMSNLTPAAGVFGNQQGAAVSPGVGSPFDLPAVSVSSGESGNLISSLLLVPQLVDQSDLYVGDSWREEAVDIALGRRPVAEADMGRGSASGGAALNVFRLRYRIAQALDSKVCAPDDVVSAGARIRSDDPDARPCAPAN